MLDLRLPIGIYFLINSVVLIATGLIQPQNSQLGTQSINLNLIWGLVMGAFGAFMFCLSKFEKKSKSE
jgi:hypothetical protein